MQLIASLLTNFPTKSRRILSFLVYALGFVKPYYTGDTFPPGKIIGASYGSSCSLIGENLTGN